MSHPSTKPDSGSPPGMPRWVKLLIIIFIVLVLLFVVLHLLGFGLGSHTPTVGYWLQQS